MSFPQTLFVLMFITSGALVQCCTHITFKGTYITALKNIDLKDEITDYNYFKNPAPQTIIPIYRIADCITSVPGFVNAVAIEIREEYVPIFYEDAIENLPLLHSIHVFSSGVSEIKSGAFRNLPSLTIMKIQDNNINTIQVNVFNNLTIRRLILTFNNIESIQPEAFNNMPRLESINLSFNKLTTWSSDWFWNCPGLKYISAKFNYLKTLPGRAFRNVQDTLERLYLSDNRINHLNHRALTGLRKLTDISLGKNENITALDEFTFLYLENLKMVDLSNTNITCLSEKFLDTLRFDVLLWIDNIPLNSTCLWILEQWAVDNGNNLTFYKTLRNTTESLT